MYSVYNKSTGPQRAMKILYRNISGPATLLEKQTMKMEEVILPENIMSNLRSDLKSSTVMLPATARSLQEWNVGILNRGSC